MRVHEDLFVAVGKHMHAVENWITAHLKSADFSSADSLPSQNDPESLTNLPMTSDGFFSSRSRPTCEIACCRDAFLAAGLPLSTPLPVLAMTVAVGLPLSGTVLR